MFNTISDSIYLYVYMYMILRKRAETVDIVHGH